MTTKKKVKQITKPQLIKKLKSLGKITREQKKQITCSIIGHSRITENCFGYITCSRCGCQIGDTLGGIYDCSKEVIVGHKCPVCVANYKTCTWIDKYLCPDPF